MCISEELSPGMLCQQLKKMRFMKKKLDGEVFTSRLSKLTSVKTKHQYFLLYFAMIQILNKYVSRQRKGVKRRRKSN